MATIYSVIESHQAEVHHNWLFTDKDSALNQVRKVKGEWIDKDKKGECVIGHNEPLEIFPYGCPKMGYWYINGEWEYGSVELIECEL